MRVTHQRKELYRIDSNTIGRRLAEVYQSSSVYGTTESEFEIVHRKASGVGGIQRNEVEQSGSRQFELNFIVILLLFVWCHVSVEC